jgi:hypothetical protein
MPAKTQEFVEVEQVRDGIIILKNKGLRGILMVSSLNFALKSEEEQKAILYQFQNFLNSLDFPCQIIVQSRKLNITPYVEKLKELEKIQNTELMQIQTSEYRRFVEGLMQEGTIMTKKFFVVVPFSIWDLEGRGGLEITQIFLKKEKKQISALSEEEFLRCRDQLYQRMEFVGLGLRRCGLQVLPLNTEEIIELLWSLHHPKESEYGYYPEIPPELLT